MSEIAIEFKNVSKKFDIRGVTKYGGTAKLSTKKVFSNLSFTIESGNIVGIIGHNGAGKSVLLKMLSKIIYPDSGTIKCDRSITSILELGIGFDPELSGRENIEIKCGYYGLSKTEISNNMENIIQFSEIGEQVDYPLRTYSSGMKAKLAFSIIMYVKSEIMILDEVLSVGDAGFHEKCKEIFKKMKKQNKTVIIASHNLNSLENLCDKILWIDKGTIKEYGDPVSVITHYNYEMKNSLELLKEIADSGDVVYQNQLGLAYYYGYNTDVDLKKAEHYFTRSSEMGFVEAKLNLAELFIKTGKKDEGLELYKKLAEQGNSVAINKLNYIDNETEINELINELEKLALEGNYRSMKLLGDLYYFGDIISKNPSKAYSYYQKCSELNNNQAQYMAAICNMEGIGTNKDISKAIEYYVKSAKNGNRKAMLDLANIYRKGIGIEKKIDDAVYWYERAALLEDNKAINELIKLYKNDLKNENMSRNWEIKCSEQILSNYEAILADIYKQKNADSEKDNIIKWYLRSQEKGNISGTYGLALCYNEGIILPLDLQKSFDLMKSLADRDYPNALYEIGLKYYRGEGVEKNDVFAFKVIEKAANMSHQKAIYQLAYFYKYGIGTEKNIDAALSELKKITESGNIQGKNLYNEILAEKE